MEMTEHQVDDALSIGPKSAGQAAQQETYIRHATAALLLRPPSVEVRPDRDVHELVAAVCVAHPAPHIIHTSSVISMHESPYTDKQDHFGKHSTTGILAILYAQVAKVAKLERKRSDRKP